MFSASSRGGRSNWTGCCGGILTTTSHLIGQLPPAPAGPVGTSVYHVYHRLDLACIYSLGRVKVPKRMNFRKRSRGGGHFQSKISYCRFQAFIWGFKTGFSRRKKLQLIFRKYEGGRDILYLQLWASYLKMKRHNKWQKAIPRDEFDIVYNKYMGFIIHIKGLNVW